MICERIPLNDEGTAYLATYLLDPEYSYKTYRSWPAMVIVPGGGYIIKGTKEGEAVAAQFLARGFSCFVVQYDAYFYDREGMAEGQPNINPKAHYPLQELQVMKALHIIHERAAEWAVDEEAIFTCGFSAGAHISGTVALRWDDPELTSQLPFEPKGEELRPAGSILGYPMLSGDIATYGNAKRDVPGNIAWQGDYILDAVFGTTTPTAEQVAKTELVNYVSDKAAPLFVWHSIDDPVVDPIETTRLVLALQEAGVFCEYHLFSNGGHGLGCANAHYAKSEAEINQKIGRWLPMAETWINEIRGCDTLPA